MMHKTSDFAWSMKNLGEDGWFAGYASVFDVLDHQREQVIRGAFSNSLKQWQQKKRLPKMLWQHDPKKPVGVWKTIREDDVGLWVEGQLLLDLRQGAEAYSLMKCGVIDALSIGYSVAKARRGYVSKVRILQEIDLHEISLVTFGANPHARITDCKALGLDNDPIFHRIQRLENILRGGGM